MEGTVDFLLDHSTLSQDTLSVGGSQGNSLFSIWVCSLIVRIREANIYQIILIGLEVSTAVRKYMFKPEQSQIENQQEPSCFSRFINARRRILQPMLDASSSETPKAKKKTPQNRPLQRFWPDSIATGGGTQQQVTMPDGMWQCFQCTVCIEVERL